LNPRKKKKQKDFYSDAASGLGCGALSQSSGVMLNGLPRVAQLAKLCKKRLPWYLLLPLRGLSESAITQPRRDRVRSQKHLAPDRWRQSSVTSANIGVPRIWSASRHRG
jgi:hypothetical protein